MTGRGGVTAHRLDHDRLVATMDRYALPGQAPTARPAGSQ